MVNFIKALFYKIYLASFYYEKKDLPHRTKLRPSEHSKFSYKK